MSSFSGSFKSEQVSDNVVRVLEELTFFSDKFKPVIVPKNFETDGASVPRALWWLFPPFGRYSAAACVHDFCYKMRKDLTFKGPKRSRKECDQIFLEAMKTLGVNAFTRNSMYAAVRGFGWAA